MIPKMKNPNEVINLKKFLSIKDNPGIHFEPKNCLIVESLWKQADISESLIFLSRFFKEENKLIK